MYIYILYVYRLPLVKVDDTHTHIYASIYIDVYTHVCIYLYYMYTCMCVHHIYFHWWKIMKFPRIGTVLVTQDLWLYFLKLTQRSLGKGLQRAAVSLGPWLLTSPVLGARETGAGLPPFRNLFILSQKPLHTPSLLRSFLPLLSLMCVCVCSWSKQTDVQGSLGFGLQFRLRELCP